MSKRTPAIQQERFCTPVNATTGAFCISDPLWEQLQPLLPRPPARDLRKGGRPRAPDRRCADAIFFVLRTGCQWNALNATGLCPSSTAHDRFQEWVRAGVFERLWQAGLERFDELQGIDWRWLALDGAQGKAPLGGEKNRPQPDRSGQGRHQAQCAD